MIWKKKWSPWQSTSAAAKTISCSNQLLRTFSRAGCQQLDCVVGAWPSKMHTMASGANQKPVAPGIIA